MSFIAKYDGRCASDECNSGAIERGDEVEYLDDELMHVGCASRERRGTNQIPPYCTDCGLHHRGAC